MAVRYGHEAPLRSVVLRAIDAIAPDTREGLETRLILRLMMEDVLPGEIGRLVERDFELPSSAALRLVRDFKFPVLIRQPLQSALLRSSKPKGDRRVWVTGQGAKDARKFFEGGGATEGELFTKDMIKRARDTLSSALGQPISAKLLRYVAYVGLIEGFEFKTRDPAALEYPAS